MNNATRTHLFTAVAVAGWLLVTTGLAAAQTSGRFEGTVTDESGGVLPGVSVTIGRDTDAGAALEQVTDSDGAFHFADLNPGQYTLTLSLPGFQEKQQTLLVRTGDAIKQTYALVLAAFSEAIDVFSEGALLDVNVPSGVAHVEEQVLAAVPLAKDRLEDALPLLPSTVRGPDGLLNMNGTRANQSSFLVNGITSTDPVTGQFAVRLPLDAVESLNVQAGIQSAQYGSTTGAVTDVVTRSGKDKMDVQFQNFLPRLRIKEGGVHGFDAFTPRLRVSGPIQRGRLWFAETVNYRFVRSRVNELTDTFGLNGSEQKFEGLDALTQIDYAVRPEHRLIGTFVVYPSNIDNALIDTLHPFAATPDLKQRGWNAALAERATLGTRSTVETAFSIKQFDMETRPKTSGASALVPIGVQQNYFNHFDRDSRRYDATTTLAHMMDGRAGEHLFKIGANVARTEYNGIDASLPVQVLRNDGTIAQRIEFAGDPHVGASNTEVAAFVEDRWAPLPRFTLHGGLRYGHEDIAGDHTFSPRIDLAFKPAAGDRTVIKAGYGRFYDKLPLNAKDFGSHQRRLVTSFGPEGTTIGAPTVDFANRVPSAGLQTPLSDAWNVEVDQLLATNLMLRTVYQERHGRRELDIDRLDDALSLSSTGRSRSRSFETTIQRRFSRQSELNVSYVRSKAKGNLNDFVSIFGTTRDPIIQTNEYSRQPFDAPNRFLGWGVFNLPRKITLAPTVEYRTGFPYTVLNEVQQVVGSRNRGGRFPSLFTLDLTATKVVRLTKTRRARIGVQLFNLTGHFNPRDVQNNLASATFGTFANSVDRQLRGKFVLMF